MQRFTQHLHGLILEASIWLLAGSTRFSYQLSVADKANRIDINEDPFGWVDDHFWSPKGVIESWSHSIPTKHSSYEEVRLTLWRHNCNDRLSLFQSWMHSNIERRRLQYNWPSHQVDTVKNSLNINAGHKQQQNGMAMHWIDSQKVMF